MRLNIPQPYFTARKEFPIAPAARQIQRSIHIGWKLAFQTRAGKASGFLFFWPLWERFTHSLWHLQAVPNAPHDLLKIRFTRCTGETITLPDGTQINKGDSIIELHFRNRAFLEMEGQTSAWNYLQLIIQNLRALAQWMEEPDFPGHPLAIYGKTLLYRGAPRLGFTLRQGPKSLHAYLERFFMIGLLVLYHRQGSARLHQGTTYQTYAQEAWISRKELLKRYAQERAVILEKR